jgi:hypothetical protein
MAAKAPLSRGFRAQSEKNEKTETGWLGLQSNLPHRANLLIALDGPIMQTMLGQDEFAPFFDQLRAEWSAELDAEGQPESLRLLIARFDPANYTFALRDGRRVPVDFQWPDPIAQQNAESLRSLADEMRVTQLPHHARQCLDLGTPFPNDQILRFREFLQGITSLWSAMIAHAPDSPLWNPSTNRTYDLDDMVFQLLGFDSRIHTLAQNAPLATAVRQMEPLFARAARHGLACRRL